MAKSISIAATKGTLAALVPAVLQMLAAPNGAAVRDVSAKLSSKGRVVTEREVRAIIDRVRAKAKHEAQKAGRKDWQEAGHALIQPMSRGVFKYHAPKAAKPRKAARKAAPKAAAPATADAAPQD